jgi:hypothetical protein
MSPLSHPAERKRHRPKPISTPLRQGASLLQRRRPAAPHSKVPPAALIYRQLHSMAPMAAHQDHRPFGVRGHVTAFPPRGKRAPPTEAHFHPTQPSRLAGPKSGVMPPHSMVSLPAHQGHRTFGVRGHITAFPPRGKRAPPTEAHYHPTRPSRLTGPKSGVMPPRSMVPTDRTPWYQLPHFIAPPAAIQGINQRLNRALDRFKPTS